MDCSLPDFSVHGIFQEEYWTGLPFPTSGYLPNPGIEPMSLASPVLAGRFFTTALPENGYVWCIFYKKYKKVSINLQMLLPLDIKNYYA